MGAWSRALRMLRNRDAADKGAPWVYTPKGAHQVDPTQREIDLRQAPEPAPAPEPQSGLTKEDAEYIKSAPNLKEKVRRAKLMGVPAEDIDRITSTALKIEEGNE